MIANPGAFEAGSPPELIEKCSQVVGKRAEKVAEIISVSDKPLAVGFGISKPQHAAEVARIADAAVVGSALVQLIEQNIDSPDLIETIRSYISSLAEAVRPVTTP